MTDGPTDQQTNRRRTDRQAHREDSPQKGSTSNNMIIKAALSTLCYEVGMRNVNWVVNAEANGEDDADAGGHVDGHLPEVEEPDDVDQGQRHARQHHHADLWRKIQVKINNCSEERWTLWRTDKVICRRGRLAPLISRTYGLRTDTLIILTYW